MEDTQEKNETNQETHGESDRVFTRKMEFASSPESYDENTNSIEVVFSTGERGMKYDWLLGRYEEELVVSKKSVDVTRLNAGAPFLDEHNGSSNYILGRIVSGSVGVSGGTLAGRVQFAPDEALSEDGRRKVALIRSGFLPGVSVGYRILESELIEKDKRKDGGTVPLLRALRWEPLEVSSVAIPFDSAAKVRAGSNFVDGPSGQSEKGNTQMDEEKKIVEEGAKPAPEPQVTETRKASTEAPQVDVEAIRKEATKAATARALEIGELAKRFAIDEKEAHSLIESGADIRDVRSRILEIVGERTARANVNPNHVGATITESEETKKAEAISQILIERLTEGKRRADVSNPYRGYSLLRIGEEQAKMRGQRPDVGSPSALAMSMLETRSGLASTDFPLAFADAVNKTIMDMTASEQALTFAAFSRRVSVNDFKSRYVVKFSGDEGFTEAAEGAPPVFGRASEEGENYKIKKYQKGISVTYEMIRNDDVSMLAALLRAIPLQWQVLQLDTFYTNFNSNPNMADGSPLFDATAHANEYGSAAVPSTTTLSDLFVKMRNQTNPSGSLLNIMPRTILCSAADMANYNAAAQILEGKFNPTASTSAVPNYMLGLQLIAEPRIAAAEWYGFADPGMFPIYEYGYLDGIDMPRIEQIPTVTTEGLKYQAWATFGCKAIDWRGGWRNGAV